MPFTKMNGLGNEFIVIDARQTGTLPALTNKAVRGLAEGTHPDTHGFDQLLVIRPPRGNGDCFMEIRNADGGEVEACGNGTRAVAAFLHRQNSQTSKTGKTDWQIETLGGDLACRVDTQSATGDADIRVNVTLPAPKFGWQDIPVAEEISTAGAKLHKDLPLAFLVNIGNPHAVIFASRKTKWMASKYGSDLEHHALFPQRANINFGQILRDYARPTILLHTWERGTGLTMACGTGACATAIAAVELGVTLTADGVLRTEVDIMPPVNRDRNESDIITIHYVPGAPDFMMRGPCAFEFDGVTML